MSDHPFANAGLGMFGSAENAFAKGAMQSNEKGVVSKLLGKGVDWLADQLGSKTEPAGSVPSPTFNSSDMAVMQPVPPVNYQINSGVNPAQSTLPVIPYSQVTPITAGTDLSVDSQPTVGSYRKFLRPQGFGSTPQ